MVDGMAVGGAFVGGTVGAIRIAVGKIVGGNAAAIGVCVGGTTVGGKVAGMIVGESVGLNVGAKVSVGIALDGCTVGDDSAASEAGMVAEFAAMLDSIAPTTTSARSAPTIASR